ncbi:MAG: medium chain dehydrogenase/reductase family protein [Salibacteraceae bacterium]
MKALILKTEGPADQAFELNEIPDPTPGPNQVLISVSHSGLNFADVMARKGLYNDRPELPCVLGYEVVGYVEQCGEAVSRLKQGDRVLAFTHFGGYASKAIAEERAIVKIGDEVDGAEATALATQYCTAWFAACMMVNLQPNDRVLIHAAAGGVGTALVQIAKWKGCEVIGTAGSEQKMEYLKSMGVDHPVNYRQEDFVKAVNKLLNGDRVDVVFDPIGGKSFRKSFSLCGSGGRIVSFGASEWSSSKGNFLDKIKLALGFGVYHPIALLMKSKSIIGLNMLRIAENRPAYLERCMSEVVRHYQSGVLKPKVDSVYPAEKVALAHQRLEGRQSIGKIALTWGNA